MKKTFKKLRLMLVSLLTLIILIPVQATELENQKLNKAIDKLRIEKGVSLASSVADKDEVIWQYTKGLENKISNQEITPNSQFRAGSVTKTFITVGVMQLVEQGKLSLDDQVRKLLPHLKIKNKWAASAPIRVRDLLSHTAGLSDNGLTQFYGPKHLIDAPLSEVLKVFDLTTRWPAGTQQAYSNIDYVIAAHLIEEITGSSYQEWLQENILIPLKMQNSTFEQKESSYKKLVSGHGSALTGKTDLVPAKPIIIHPAGSLITTLDDLTRFTQMLLNNGEFAEKRIISEASLRLMENSALDKITPRNSFTYGMGLYARNSDRFLSYCHAGAIDGFLADICYSKQMGLTFVSLSNSFGLNGSQVYTEVQNIIKDKAVLSPAVQLDFDTAPWQGLFRPNSPRHEAIGSMAYISSAANIEFTNNSLIIKPLFGSEMKYNYVGGQLFRPVNKIGASLALTKNMQGQAIIQDGWDTFAKDQSPFAELKNWALVLFLISSILLSFCVLITVLYSLWRWFSKKEKCGIWLLRLSSLSLFLCLGILGLTFSKLIIWNLPEFNIQTAILWLFSNLLPITLFFFTFMLVKNFSVLSTKWNKAYWTINIISQWGVLFYLMYFGIFNTRLWG